MSLYTKFSYTFVHIMGHRISNTRKYHQTVLLLWLLFFIIITYITVHQIQLLICYHHGTTYLTLPVAPSNGTIIIIIIIIIIINIIIIICNCTPNSAIHLFSSWDNVSHTPGSTIKRYYLLLLLLIILILPLYTKFSYSFVDIMRQRISHTW